MVTEVHVYAAFVHGFLVFGHLLGIVHNVRRRNRVDIGMHAVALGYSLRSVRHHLRECRPR